MNKKITCTRIRPNPILEDCLAKMYEEARLTDSDLKGMLKEALDSLIKYPLPIKSGAECMLLKGFDRKLCAYLDKFIEHNNNDALSKNSGPKPDDVVATGSDKPISKTTPLPFRENVPQSRSSDLGPDKYLSVDLTRLPELASQLDSHVNFKPIETDEVQYSYTTQSIGTKNIDNGKVKAKKGEKKTYKYKPAHRSGGYAILVALLEQSSENSDKSSLTKDELIEKAQKHAEESFVRPKIGTRYTAWSSMSLLQKRGLVSQIRKKKAEYLLTVAGIELAREMLRESKHIPSTNDIIFNDVPPDSSAFDAEIPSTSGNINQFSLSQPTTGHSPLPDWAIPPSPPPSTSNPSQPPSSGNTNQTNVIEMAPGTFDIKLLIDKNETGGLRKKYNPTVAQFNKYPDLEHEYRSLKVGDFTWIAKHKVNQDLELVLPFIVERKRMDDLAASIKDGRFHEQKFRLHKCGIDNVIYMIENYGKNKNVGLPIQNLMQAIANTRVQNGFKVHVTDSLTNSARFLAMLTRRLTIRFKDKHLRGCSDDPQGDMLMTFEYFNKSSAKTRPLTVTDTFIKLLLQLKGMSVEKALAITKKYPTPRSLIHAYVKCERKEGETLLAHLKFGELNRNVGPATSKSIYQLFSSSGAE